MEAFLLAAGLGTRLRPLTDNRPKALVEVNGHSLLEINILNLISQGFDHIVVNVHHFADQIVSFLGSRHWDATILISSEQDCLLDTGAGLKRAASLFSLRQPVLVHNVDILSRIPLADLYAYHLDSMSLATLAVSQRSSSRQLLFSGDGNLCGWRNTSSNQEIWTNNSPQPANPYAFSGIAVVSPQLLNLLPPASQPYPIIPAYLNIANNHRINNYIHQPNDWLDVGKPETLDTASSFLNA